MMTTNKEIASDKLFDLIHYAIEICNENEGMSLSPAVDVICQYTNLCRENVLRLFAAVGVQMNMELGYSYQEALNGFFGK